MYITKDKKGVSLCSKKYLTLKFKYWFKVLFIRSYLKTDSNKVKYKSKINEIAIFKDNLNIVNLFFLNNQLNSSLAFNTFENTLSACFKNSFPLVKANLSKQPWITVALLV